MIEVPLYRIAAASPAVVAVLGSPPRISEFGSKAHDQVSPGRPYAIWQRIGGAPENLLAGRPLEDSVSIQVDVYAASQPLLREAVAALVSAIELHAYIVAWNLSGRDPDTRDFFDSFTVDWWLSR